MTDDDFTIEGLDALAGSTADEIMDDGFSASVIGRIAKHRKRKAITLGAAGSIGSAIAGAQMTAFVAAMPVAAATSDVASPLLNSVTIETIAATALAGLAAVIALIVPGRV